MLKLKRNWCGIGSVAVLACLPAIAVADTLSEVLERGALRCAVIEASPGFSAIDANAARIRR